MINLFIIEFYKLKRSWMFTCALAGMCVSPIMTTAMFYTYAKENSGTELLLSKIFSQNHLFSMLVINLLLFGLIATYIINREYMEKTISSVLTIPVSRFSYLTTKILVTLFSVLILTGLSFLLVLVIGILFQAKGITMEVLLTALAYYYKGALLLFPCVITSILVACISKNYIVPIVFSIIVVIIGIFLTNHETYALLYPWSIPLVLSFPEWKTNQDLVSISLMITTGYTFLTILTSYAYFYRSDID